MKSDRWKRWALAQGARAYAEHLWIWSYNTADIAVAAQYRAVRAARGQPLVIDPWDEPGQAHWYGAEEEQ